MPTYALDESFFEEYDIPLNEDEFTRAPNGMLVSEFSGETKPFRKQNLDAEAQIVLSQLEAIGVTRVEGRYDGGGDEGFAHFEKAFRGEQELPFSELAAQLTASVESIARADSEKQSESSHVIFMNCYYPRDMFEALTPEQRVKEALDFFSYFLASELLGGGFGTGVEGVMYGAFRANLETGEIVDQYAEAPEGTFDEYPTGSSEEN
ncbi:hypothetical protein EON80_08635 [bacterium]|nr:MAG: hypothetical protein EON80_08635 [bacterium]